MSENEELEYQLNEHQRDAVRLRVNYFLGGGTFMPYERWLALHPEGHFHSLVSRGVLPLLTAYDYSTAMGVAELGGRIAYWAWEVYARHHSPERRQIQSLAQSGTGKSRSQYEAYTLTITNDVWNNVFDEWAHDGLFNTATLEGGEQRNSLPDFLWKLVRDDQHHSSDEEESDEEGGAAPARPKGTQIHELGWVTNNRRKF
jgi:hypothetical protein